MSDYGYFRNRAGGDEYGIYSDDYDPDEEDEREVEPDDDTSWADDI
jgi:hypothetical protein